MKTKKITIHFLVVLLSLFFVIEIFYLSWLPNGRLGKETHLPLWLLNWSNTYFNLRTAIPFTALSFLFQTWYSISSKVVVNKIKLPFWLINIFIAAILVCVAEVGQFFIPLRHPDFMDVFTEFQGVFWVVFYIIYSTFLSNSFSLKRNNKHIESFI